MKMKKGTRAAVYSSKGASRCSACIRLVTCGTCKVKQWCLKKDLVAAANMVKEGVKRGKGKSTTKTLPWRRGRMESPENYVIMCFRMGRSTYARLVLKGTAASLHTVSTWLVGLKGLLA